MSGAAILPSRMKAAYCDRYGSPNVIGIREIDLPNVGDNDVLIRVRAASINAFDSGLLKGKPLVARLMFGVRGPKGGVPGRDVAGTVEAVGAGVSRFKPGDDVFGVCRGSCAEFACTTEGRLAHKPESVKFEQAASLPIAGITALQAIRDKATVQPGHRVLIHGAAGGVGTFSVQIAKAFGGVVTAVCGRNHLEFVRALGADEVIDYSSVDFTRSGEKYDLIIDNAANRSVSDLRRLLTAQGRIIMAGAPRSSSFWRLVFYMLNALVASWFGTQKITLVSAKVLPADLEFLGDLVASGKVIPAIERTYSLDETRDAFRYLTGGHVAGKLVITLCSAEPERHTSG